MKQVDDSYIKLIEVMILILFVTGMLIGFFIADSIEDSECQYSDNFISAVNSPIFIKNQTLASMSSDIDTYQLAYKIIQCESSWSPNAKNKGSSAYGLGQFINGTWDYVQNKWNIELERDNPEDQMYALVRLLEEEGPRHWESSRQCWDK
jgi:hypothetical protein